MSHGIFSEAITRFTKGRPALDLEPALGAAMASFITLGGDLIGLALDSDSEVLESPAPIELTAKEINSLLGSDYSKELIERTLENTNFSVEDLSGDKLAVTAPTWRTDIHIKEDVIEEVGRLLGFDNLPLAFPTRPFVCPEVDPILTLKSDLRTRLSDRLGANELLTYSFVSKALQEKVGEDPADSYLIVNSLSPELECFRQSLVPSLLDKILGNEKSGFKDFTLYELNQVSKKSWGLTDENVPNLETHLGLTTFGDFYRAKQILLELGKFLRLDFRLEPLEKSAFLEPLHSASVYLGDAKVGEFGEVKLSVLKRFKLAAPLSALELSLEPLIGAESPRTKEGIKLSKFPSVSRDLTFRVSEETPFAGIDSAVRSVLNDLDEIVYSLTPVSIFRKSGEDSKNLSFHLELSSRVKTLDSREISDIIEKIINHLKALGAEVV